MKEIYLDNNATTKVDERVFEEMRPYFCELYGNPSSMHFFGGQVQKKVDEARSRVAALLGALRRDAVARQPLRIGRGDSRTGVDSARAVFQQDDFGRRPWPGRARAAPPRTDRLHQPGSIRPSWVAITAAARRELTPNFARMFFMWKFTTASEQPRIGRFPTWTCRVPSTSGIRVRGA